MSATAWQRAVQYRYDCEECGERRVCAVIRRRNGRPRIRLCLGCYVDGHWRRSGDASARAAG